MGSYKYTQYSQSNIPPIPIHPGITILHPRDKERKYPVSLRGEIDSGADKTAIHQKIVKELNLVPCGEMRCVSYDGRETTQKKYRVHLMLEGQNFQIEVVSTRIGEALIGRDIINNFTVILRGKKGVFEIEDS